MQDNDPRATIVDNVRQDQEQVDRLLVQLQKLQHKTIDEVISFYQKYPAIRQEPHFVDFIFDNIEIYVELIGWILQPLKMIQKRQQKQQAAKKLKSSLNSPNSSPASPQQNKNSKWKKRYPYYCMKIVKNNPYFYQMMYLKAYKEELSLKVWFQFLQQKNLQTIDTSLGYLTQIMTPFVRYQFSDSYKISQYLQKTQQTKRQHQMHQKKLLLNQQSQPNHNSFLFNSCQTPRPLTQFQKQKKRRNITLEQGVKDYYDDSLSILRVFSAQLINFILKYINYQQIFLFIHNLVLSSLQEVDLKRSKKILEALFHKAVQTNQHSQFLIQMNMQEPVIVIDTCSEYMRDLLKQICSNVNTQKNYRVIFFIDSILKVQLIEKYLQRIKSSFLLSKQPQDKSALTSSVDFTTVQQEQQKLQYYLQSLTFILKIYLKMNKHQNRSEEDLQRQSKYYMEDEFQDTQALSPDLNQNRQLKVLRQFSLQISLVFENLPFLSNLVKKNQSRAIPFSSGQNIKPITICKYEFFQMVLNCLLLARQFPDKFMVNTEKLDLFSIIERYLNQNRWNNIVHKTLQKIAYMLIVNNNNFFRTNKNNMADAFLDSVIQNFTNKNYIFLNSLRFTTQGNIHTLYIIAKAIIYELKKSHKLANFIHEFQYYKKFVMNDLQAYQTKIFQIQNKPNEEEIRKSNRKDDEQPIKLEVDQLSIKEIVRKIQIINKWPIKENRKRYGSTVQRSLSFVNDDKHNIYGNLDLFNTSTKKSAIGLQQVKQTDSQNKSGQGQMQQINQIRHFQSAQNLQIHSARKEGEKMIKSVGNGRINYIQEAQTSNNQQSPVFIHVISQISPQKQREQKEKCSQYQLSKQKDDDNKLNSKQTQFQGFNKTESQTLIQGWQNQLDKYEIKQQAKTQNNNSESIQIQLQVAKPQQNAIGQQNKISQFNLNFNSQTTLDNKLQATLDNKLQATLDNKL